MAKKRIERREGKGQGRRLACFFGTRREDKGVAPTGHGHETVTPFSV